jgi:hypothetical protein
MLFFGGFGSVLPYIVYLSAVWICIIIGVRGQFKGLLGFKTPVETKIEAVAVNIQHTEVAHLFELRITKQKPAIHIPFDYFLLHTLISEIHNILPRSIYLVRPLFSHIIDASGLRAPPIVTA